MTGVRASWSSRGVAGHASHSAWRVPCEQKMVVLVRARVICRDAVRVMGTAARVGLRTGTLLGLPVLLRQQPGCHLAQLRAPDSRCAGRRSPRPAPGAPARARRADAPPARARAAARAPRPLAAGPPRRARRRCAPSASARAATTRRRCAGGPGACRASARPGLHSHAVRQHQSLARLGAGAATGVGGRSAAG